MLRVVLGVLIVSIGFIVMMFRCLYILFVKL